jgi:hypothetical protein
MRRYAFAQFLRPNLTDPIAVPPINLEAAITYILAIPT